MSIFAAAVRRPSREYWETRRTNLTFAAMFKPKNGRKTMRFIIIVKATKDTEAGTMPEESMFAAMTNSH